MAIEDHCGWCDTCRQPSMARWQGRPSNGMYLACVWCSEAITELVERPSYNNRPRKIPFAHLCILFGMRRLHRYSYPQLAARTDWVLADEDTPLWEHYGFASETSMAQSLRKAFIEQGWVQADAVPGRAKGTRPGRPSSLPASELHALAERYRAGGVTLAQLADPIWQRLGYSSRDSCASSLYQMWRYRGWITKKETPREKRSRARKADRGNAGPDQLEPVAALAENAA